MTKFSFEVKLKAVQMYLGGIGAPTIARRLGIKGRLSVQTWVARYQKYGIQGLEIRSPKFDYDGDFKLKVLNWKNNTRPRTHRQHFNLISVVQGQSLTGKGNSRNVGAKPCLPEEDGQST
ncbi:helix-turn-helix domain-containing protein [Limosilactobacillus oris]|uniref:helix-turn-helix domain-containing protein n=1 Tax=Limosilactobacillus oris TaxID=1632 RepID=UPI001145C5B2|nr:helix-turn-helix domain-containing protein [Limosilactobacillus oris]